MSNATTYAIALTINDKIAYVAEPSKQWDASWYTRKIEEAWTYRLKRNAERRLAEDGAMWSDLEPRVVEVAHHR